MLQGGTYALAAFGLSLIFCIAEVLNITHGEFLMLGGLVTYILFSATGWNPFLILLIVIPLFILVGIGLSKGIYQTHSESASPAALLLVHRRDRWHCNGH